jgi:hypothetical protein
MLYWNGKSHLKAEGAPPSHNIESDGLPIPWKLFLQDIVQNHPNIICNEAIDQTMSKFGRFADRDMQDIFIAQIRNYVKYRKKVNRQSWVRVGTLEDVMNLTTSKSLQNLLTPT